MRDQSIDIETLSVETDAAIVAIGVQEFDLESGKLGRTFYREVDVASALKAGRIDGATMVWWMAQSSEARKIFTAAKSEHRRSIPAALDELATFMRATQGSVPRLWARGSHFDVAILEWNYRHSAIALAIPWHFRNVHELRTLIDLAEKLAAFDESSVGLPAHHIPHNALSDATHQARVACAAFAAIKGASPAKGKSAAPATAPAAPPPEVDPAAFTYWSHPESGSMIKTLGPVLSQRDRPGWTEVDEAAYKKWDDEQL